jgi:hypothetical protein
VGATTMSTPENAQKPNPPASKIIFHKLLATLSDEEKFSNFAISQISVRF